MDRLKTFDAYAKTMDDFRVKTTTGALLSISSIICVVLLVMSEYLDFRNVHVQSELVVDKSRRDRLPIIMNMTFHKMPCHLLNVDVMDVSGEQQNDVSKNLLKIRMDRHGIRLGPENPHQFHNFTDTGCGKCYGAEPPVSGCCNSCDDVREAYSKKGWVLRNYNDVEQCVNEGWAEKLDFETGEGCEIQGQFTVNKVAGNFHFAPGKSFKHQQMHVHDIESIAEHLGDFDFTHTIHELSFGASYEGVNNPLNGHHKQGDSIPSTVSYLNGTKLSTNQYSVTQYDKNQGEGHGTVMPGIFFNYDISPMKVIYTESKKSFSSFLTGVCAIVGGIFTIAGFIDAFVYSAERAVKKKIDLGKVN